MRRAPSIREQKEQKKELSSESRVKQKPTIVSPVRESKNLENTPTIAELTSSSIENSSEVDVQSGNVVFLEILKEEEQNGKDCGFIALDCLRDDVIGYINEHVESDEIRQLLVPEIKNKLQEEIDDASIRKDLLGESDDAELRRLFEDDRNIESSVEYQNRFIACNDLLGNGEGRRKSIDELRKYFTENSEESDAKAVFDELEGIINGVISSLCNKLKEKGVCKR